MPALAALRRRALLSQRDLARRAGVAPSSVYLIERGRTLPRPAVMRKLADALGVSDPMQVDEFRRAVVGDADEADWESGLSEEQVLDAASDPVLAELWDNEDDAEYDRLATSNGARAAS